MGVQKSAKRQQARMKSRGAGFAAPRQDSRDTQQTIPHRPALGTPDIRTATKRTACPAGCDLFFSPQSIGEVRGNQQEVMDSVSASIFRTTPHFSPSKNRGSNDPPLQVPLPSPTAFVTRQDFQ